MSDDRPGMRRTNPGDLLLPLVVVGVAVYVLLRFTYDSIPQLQYFLAVPLGGLGLVELVVARRVRGAVRHEPHARPMTAIAIARCVALGKATSLVGAGVGGAALGLLGRTLPDAGDISAAAHDSRVGVALLVVAVLMVVAGLLLERSGIDPGNEHRRREHSSERF
jgi:hypothetical protein